MRGATARPRAACCSPSRATRACTCSSSSARRWTTPPSRRSRGACTAGAEQGRYDVELRELAALAGGEEEQARAIIGHLARAGMVQPTPRRRTARAGGSSAHGTRGAARLPRSAGEAQSVRWRQYRAIWAFVEQRRCRRTAMLRHFGDASPPATPACRAATCAIRRSCRPRPPRRPRDGAAPPASGAGRPRRGDPRRRRRRRARRRSHARRRDPLRRALEGDRAALLRRPAGVRHVRAPAARRGARARRRAARLRARCARPVGASRSSRRHERALAVLASGAGSNLQAILDTVQRARGRRGGRGGIRRPDAPALGRAERAGVPAARFPWTSTSTARRATPRWPTGSPVAARASSCWRATCSCSRRLPRALPAGGRQRAPGAAARVPGP